MVWVGVDYHTGQIKDQCPPGDVDDRPAPREEHTDLRGARNNQVCVNFFNLQMKIYRVNRNIPLSPSSPYFPFQEGH